MEQEIRSVFSKNYELQSLPSYMLLFPHVLQKDKF